MDHDVVVVLFTDTIATIVSQVLSTRARKDVKVEDITIQVSCQQTSVAFPEQALRSKCLWRTLATWVDLIRSQGEAARYVAQSFTTSSTCHRGLHTVNVVSHNLPRVLASQLPMVYLPAIVYLLMQSAESIHSMSLTWKHHSITLLPHAQVCLYAFDCLYLNGDTLIQRPLEERRRALYESIEEREGELLHAKTLVSASRSPDSRMLISGLVLKVWAACFVQHRSGPCLYA